MNPPLSKGRRSFGPILEPLNISLQELHTAKSARDSVLGGLNGVSVQSKPVAGSLSTGGISYWASV